MGKALAPKAVLFVSDLPKTRNAKVMRRMIRVRLAGRGSGRHIVAGEPGGGGGDPGGTVRVPASLGRRRQAFATGPSAPVPDRNTVELAQVETVNSI